MTFREHFPGSEIPGLVAIDMGSKFKNKKSPNGVLTAPVQYRYVFPIRIINLGPADQNEHLIQISVKKIWCPIFSTCIQLERKQVPNVFLSAAASFFDPLHLPWPCYD